MSNPVLVVEVTSASTEHYDRGEKLRHYQQLASLREILVVSHREPRITLVSRQLDGTWAASDARSDASVALASIGSNLAVNDVFREGLEDVEATH